MLPLTDRTTQAWLTILSGSKVHAGVVDMPLNLLVQKSGVPHRMKDGTFLLIINITCSH